MSVTTFDIDMVLLQKMFERAKALKCTFSLFINTAKGIDCIGILGGTAVKTAIFTNDSLYTAHLADGDKLINMAIKTSDLNIFVKQCIEDKAEKVTVHCYSTDIGIIPFKISSFNDEVYLAKFDQLFSEYYRITTECASFSNDAEIKVDLSNDPNFSEITDLKAADGARLFNIGKYPIMISPAMLGLNKGDTAFATIYPSINPNNKFLVFTVNKTKKKCIFEIIMRILPL